MSICIRLRHVLFCATANCGEVVLQEHVKSLREQHSSWRSKTAAPQSETAWTGLGSDLPAQVEGLRNVQSISLGGVHALALVDDDD